MVIFSSLFTSCNEEELDPNICKITVKSEGNGTVSITDYIGTSVNVLIGNRVEVVATPDEGWAFIGWYVSGSESPVSTDAAFTFITSENITLTARFAKLSDIIIRSGGNGSVAFKNASGNSIPVLPGAEVTVIATPNEDCDFAGWFIGDSETPVSTETEYTFIVTENIILTGKFSKRPVVTVQSAGNGSVSIKDTYWTNNKAFLPGTEVTVIAKPYENCDFIGWFVANEESPISTDAEYTFTVTEDILLIAKFYSGEYINETFASSFGVFSTEETVGNYPWVIDYSTAKATSYVDGANNAATSWLISSPVDFTNETEAYVAFDYIIRYSESGKVASYHQLLISTDYAGNAAEATWVDLPYNAVEGSDWATFYKANVNIPGEFIGKANVTFALRYTATTKASTWEVKNFKVARGKVDVIEPEVLTEYTVTEAIAAYTGIANPAIVKGYIVGSVNGQVYTEGCVFSGVAEVKTNLLIADNPDETDHNNCIPVQLPSGAVRNALNLVDNPGNYKKFVTLTGSLEKYFGVAGLKSVSKYVIEGATPEEPETPDTPEGTYISESFATSFGSFTTQETVGNYPWKFEEYNGKGYAKASGYANGASQDAESWLISPAIDFTNETAAYIAFDYVINKGDASAAAANHKLVITSNYTGDVATTEWTEVNYGAVNNNSWTFQNTGEIALPASMMGKAAVVIAFKYMSTTANSSTWEIKNVVVASGTGATPETPETPEPEEPETPDTPDTPTAEAGVFDFTNPEGLTPSVKRATVEAGSTQGAGVEASEYTFTNGNVTVKVSQGSATTPVRFWTRTGDDVELRTYKSSTITVSVSDGTMSSIVFEGGKVSTMSASTGSFSAGTWSGSAQSVTFSVSGTLNIQKLTVK